MTKTIKSASGTKAVVVNSNGVGSFWATLYVNCTPNGLGDITCQRKTAKRMATIEKWAAGLLN